MKIKGRVNWYNDFGDKECDKKLAKNMGAEIELSAEALAKQLSETDMCDLWEEKYERPILMKPTEYLPKKPMCAYGKKVKPTEPERCEHEWADLLYSSGGACGCWNTFRCIKCGELKSVENKPEPPKRIEGEHIHFGIKEEPNGTIGLYKNGKKVNDIDFWIFDQRTNPCVE